MNPAPSLHAVRAVAILLSALAADRTCAGQDASAPEEVGLTIRDGGLAAVREVRTAQLVSGENRLRIYDVSPQILPETVAARSLATPDLLDLREQSVWFEVLDPDRALERLAGRPASLYRWHDGVEEKLDGRLLFPPVVPGPEGPVRVPLYLEQQDGKIRLLDSAEVELTALPAGDWNRTRVDWRVVCRRPDRYRFELTYLTRGLSWHADAALRVAVPGETADVELVATVENQTGVAWRQARLSFLEGDGPIADAHQPADGRASALFHPYDDPVSLEPRRSTQVLLASAHDVPVAAVATLFLDAAEMDGDLPIRRRYDVVNSAGKGLGRALPAATARTLLIDDKNRPIPSGEGALPAAAPDETLSFPGPIEPGLFAHVALAREGAAAAGRRHAAIDLWSERATAARVEIVVALSPVEHVVDCALPVDLPRPGAARVVLTIPPKARATVTFAVARR